MEDVAIVTFEHAAGHSTQLARSGIRWTIVNRRAASRLFFEGGYIATEHDYFGSVVYQGRSGNADHAVGRRRVGALHGLEGLDPVDYDLRSLGGMCDRAFIEAAIARRAASSDFADALLAHEIVEACYRSAAEARDVTLAEYRRRRGLTIDPAQ